MNNIRITLTDLNENDLIDIRYDHEHGLIKNYKVGNYRVTVVNDRIAAINPIG